MVAAEVNALAAVEAVLAKVLAVELGLLLCCVAAGVDDALELEKLLLAGRVELASWNTSSVVLSVVASVELGAVDDWLLLAGSVELAS